jgi:hypothetical protein
MLNPRKQPFTSFSGICGVKFSKIFKKIDPQDCADLKLARVPVRSPLPWRLYLLCLARRSLGEGGSLFPPAPLRRFLITD